MADDETWDVLAKRLAALVVTLEERNARLDTWIIGQETLNTRLTEAVERIDITLADLRTLMREVFRERQHGRAD